jgi:hypothetical protein
MGNSIAANADIRYWTNCSSWPSALLSVIPASTSTSIVAYRWTYMWKGYGIRELSEWFMADGSGTDRYCMIYRPWYVNEKVVPFQNPGCWFTITLPFSLVQIMKEKLLVML